MGPGALPRWQSTASDEGPVTSTPAVIVVIADHPGDNVVGHTRAVRYFPVVATRAWNALYHILRHVSAYLRIIPYFDEDVLTYM